MEGIPRGPGRVLDDVTRNGVLILSKKKKKKEKENVEFFANIWRNVIQSAVWTKMT